MVRKMGVIGTIKATVNRIRSNKIGQRKTNMNIDCFWSSYDSSEYEDIDVLLGLR